MRITFSILLPTLLASAPSAAILAQPPSNWDSVTSELRVFVRRPTASSSSQLVKDLSRVDSACGRRDSAYIRFYDTADTLLGRFHFLILRSNEPAARVALAVIAVTNTYVAEELSTSIGTLIRKNPRLFLRLVNTDMHEVHLNTILLGLAREYVDDDRACQQEYLRRIKALKKVTDPRLRNIRDMCIAILQEGAG
jgi:hypothetical protein